MEKTPEEILAIPQNDRTQEQLDALDAAKDTLTPEQTQQLADEEEAANRPPATTVEEVLAKAPGERTAAEITLVENAPDLTPEQIQQVEDENAALDNPPAETPEEKKTREDKERKDKSAIENTVVRKQNQVLTERLSEVNEVKDPTDDELKEYEPEYDELTDAEKRITKRQWKSDKRAEQVHSIALETKNDQVWNAALDEFINVSDAKDEFPLIVKNRDEFVKYATQKLHRGVPLDVLANAFYGMKGMTKEAPRRINLMNRGGTNGRTTIVNPTVNKKIRPEDVKVIRKDMREYRKQIPRIIKDLGEE